MLTIAPLKQWSVRYYNDTSRAAVSAALDREKAGGGLGEYYSEGESRTPFWMCAGDAETSAALCGLSAADRAGGEADLDVVARWLDDGVAPSGACGRKFSQRANHGFDLTFCAPKSVSLLRALDTTGVASKAVVEAHNRAVAEALEYLHTHAGYTRVHNNMTGMKDLQRLPGLVAAAYQHETSRAGDPHLHTHVLVPNKQARADGTLVAIDSDSLWHEARAAGIIYQATLRAELHAALGIGWEKVDPHSGMAELAGVDPELIAAASQRSTQLSEWAAQNLIVDGNGKPTAGQLARAQKATRPRKPEHRPWAELKAEWAQRFGAELALDEPAQQEALTRLRKDSRAELRTWAGAAVRGIDKPAFTRADLIETLGAHMPTVIDDAPPIGPRLLLEQLVDAVGLRVTEARQPHEREGHERYTALVIAREETAIYSLIGARDKNAAVAKTIAETAAAKAKLSADQAGAVVAIASSPWLVQVLSAPAGAGKTTSLKALRRAAKQGGIEHVWLAAPTGNAADVALAEGAADGGGTVAGALKALRENRLTFDSKTLLVIDEAGMVGTPALRELLTAATAAGTKTVLVGDAEQLAPVKARGGMFAQLCADLPWAQKLSEVWRMRDPDERAASLAIHDGTPASLAHAVDWYRNQQRLHTGDPVTMADDAFTAWTTDHANDADSLLIADRWEVADALNQRIHRHLLGDDAPTVAGARRHRIGVGDVIITRRNDPTIDVYPQGSRDPVAGAPVRNGQRWKVTRIDTEVNRLLAVRIGDQARAVFSDDYLRQHVHHGYAITVHAAQGATAEHCHALLSPDTGHRANAYVAMTRGRATNTVYLYQRLGGEGDHEHASQTVEGVHTPRRGDDEDAAAALLGLLNRDNTAHTVITTAENTPEEQLSPPVRVLLEQRKTALDKLRIVEQLEEEKAWLNTAFTATSPRATHYIGVRQTLDRADGLDEETRAAAQTVVGSLPTVQSVHLHDDQNKPALLSTITACVVAGEHKVLALPVTDRARRQAPSYSTQGNTYAPETFLRDLDNATLTIEEGTLLIVDDADHLQPEQLHRLTARAAEHSAKLVLVTTDADDPNLTADAPSRHLTDAANIYLNWGHRLGTDTPANSAIQHRAAQHKDDPLISETLDHTRKLVKKLSRRPGLGHRHDRDQSRQRSRDDGSGLEL